METSKYFQILPDELLLEIFHFVNIEEIVTSIQNVCVRWKNVCEDNKLWKKLSFKPSLTNTNDEIVTLLKLMPRLRSFVFNSNCNVDLIIHTLCMYCRDLQILVCDGVIMLPTYLQSLLAHIPSIESLQFSHTQMVDYSILEILRHYPNLKKLTNVNVGPFSSYHEDENFTGFEALEHLEMVAYCTDEYLTVHENHTGALNSVHFLHHIPTCKNITYLSIDFRMLRFSGFKSALCNITKMKHLKTLRLKSFFHSQCNILADMFQTGNLPFLQSLDLSNSLNVHFDAIRYICKACMYLRKLYLSRCLHLDDKCVKEICCLQFLQRLDLSCCAQVNATGLESLHYCNELTVLDLSWRTLITQTMIQKISAIPSLRVLILNHTNVTTNDLLHLLMKCPYISYVSIVSCLEVDSAALQLQVPHCQINCNQMQEIPFIPL